MSMCRRCGTSFTTSEDVKKHLKLCDEPEFQRDTTPSYREYLVKAAEKDLIYQIYLIRADVGKPDNAYNPLATARKGTKWN